jgi:hypothetical protein
VLAREVDLEPRRREVARELGEHVRDHAAQALERPLQRAARGSVAQAVERIGGPYRTRDPELVERARHAHVGHADDRPGYSRELQQPQVRAQVLGEAAKLARVRRQRRAAAHERQHREVLQQPGSVERLEPQQTRGAAETHGLLPRLAAPRALERERGGGIGEHLAAAHGRERVVLVDAAEDGVEAERRDRRELDRLERRRAVEGERDGAVQPARVDPRRLDGPVAPALREQLGRRAARAAAPHDLEQQRRQVAAGDPRREQVGEARDTGLSLDPADDRARHWLEARAQPMCGASRLRSAALSRSRAVFAWCQNG